MNLLSLDKISLSTVLLGVPIIILGWTVGSIINYLSDVLPVRRRLARPFCKNCGSDQSLLNFLIITHRCPTCGILRPWRTWIVDLATILSTLWLWFIPQHIPSFLINIVLLLYFGMVVVIDIEHRLILHHVSLVGVGIGIVIGFFLHGLASTIIGGLVGFLGMLLLYYFGILFSKGISRWRHEEIEEEALGFGDVNLSGVLGLILGWPGITLGIIGAILIGGMISFLYLIYLVITRRYHSFTAFPYGPCLIASAVILLYFRDIL